MVGIEIRKRVVEWTQNRVKELRESHSDGTYDRVQVIRSNGMKFLPRYFDKGQLTKLFFMHPDPHFKKRKHRRRIISSALLAVYAYVLREGGMLYTVTDVKELYEWMMSHLDAHPLFERVSEDELKDDILIPHVLHSSEDGAKVRKNAHVLKSYLAVYRRVSASKERKLAEFLPPKE
jgi:tRNA (guanine-N7-)-methyltransferase